MGSPEPIRARRRLTRMRACNVCGESDAAQLVKRAASVEGLMNKCRSCYSAERALRYAENPEPIKARVRAYQAAHGPGIAARWRAAYAANPGPHRAHSAKWRSENPALAASIVSASHAKRAGHYRMLKRLAAERRRTRLLGALCEPGAIPVACDCPCGAPAEELDHIVPVSRGGCGGAHNLRWLCRSCNRRKSASLPEQYDGCPIFWGALGLQ